MPICCLNHTDFTLDLVALTVGFMRSLTLVERAVPRRSPILD